MQTLLPEEELVALNIAFEDAHPREILSWALETSGLERIAVASAFQSRGHRGDAPRHADPARHPDPVPGDRLPVRRDARVQAADHRAPRPERRRPLRRVHRGAPGEGVRSPAVRARPRAVLRAQQGAAHVRGAPRLRRVGDRAPPRLLAHPRERAVRGAVRDRAGPLDGEGQPDGHLDASRRLGLPEGARPPAQPALRPRATPRSAARRARGCGSRASPSAPAGGPGKPKWECGIHANEAAAAEGPTRVAQATTQSASRASSISSRRWSPSESPSTCTGNGSAAVTSTCEASCT